MQHKNSKLIISGGFVAVIISVLLVGITGLHQLAQLNSKQDLLTNQYDQKRDLVHQMLSFSRERAISLTLMVNIEDPFDRDKEFIRYNHLGALFARAREELLDFDLSADEHELLQQQGDAVSVALAAQNAVLKAIGEEDHESASYILTNEAIPWQQQVFGSLQQLADLQQNIYHEKLNLAATTHSNAYLLFIAMLGVIATIVGGLVVVLVTRHIQQTETALSDSNERFELAMRGANDGLWDWNIKTNEVFFSPRWKQMLGYDEKEITNHLQHWESSVHPDDLDNAWNDIRQHLRGDTPLYQNRHRMRHQDGSYRWHLERGICVRDEEGTPLRMVGTTTDITERELAEDALFTEKERAQVTLHSIGDAVMTTDDAGRLTYLNPAAELLTGWLNEEAIGKQLEELVELQDEYSKFPLENPVDRCLQTGKVTNLEIHTLLIDRDGNEKPITDTAAPIRDRDGSVIGAVMVCHDVSESRRMAKQMSWQATHDSLTGLINRRELERRLQQYIDNAHHGECSHGFLYLDLDQFKIVNDTSGHVAGDELLRQLGFLLHETIERGDTLARLGGDEFGVLLHDCSEERALIAAERLHTTIRNFRFVTQGKTFEIGASIGMVMIGADSGNINDVMSMADMACYAAKDQGRNRIQVYQPENKELAQRHRELRWLNEISQSLEQNRFVLYRQGISDCRNTEGPIRHAEILVRMLDDKGNLIEPDQFIPAAERYDLMPNIDRWVIANTFEFVAKHPNILDTVSINLSGNSFSNEEFLHYVFEQLNQSNVPARKICFEITETAAIANLSAAIHFIRELKKVGVRFALDDFGSGLSSFAYLKNLPVDSVKIDGTFIKDMVNNPIDRAMVEAICSIAKVMGIKTIAEFVENPETLEQLQPIGVDMIQGHYIEKPQPLLATGNILPIRATDSRYR